VQTTYRISTYEVRGFRKSRQRLLSESHVNIGGRRECGNRSTNRLMEIVRSYEIQNKRSVSLLNVFIGVHTLTGFYEKPILSRVISSLNCPVAGSIYSFLALCQSSLINLALFSSLGRISHSNLSGIHTNP